ncbi:substrate-binding periplasmic protein [Niveispirillum fermenti]|uniref:substrate-binding periplasmic protein n=1 Tax=Niveispirillum fermenti TaxID=1233113 RepID=UPI003A89207F
MRVPGRPWRFLPAVLLAAILLQPATVAGAPDGAGPQPVTEGPAVEIVCGPLPFVSDGPACERGIGAELARAACGDAGLQCRFQQYPWPRAQKEVEMAAADILIGPYYTPERSTWLVFSQEYFYVDQMWLFRSVPPGDAPLPSQEPRLIGVPLGWAVGGDLERRPGTVLEIVRTVDLALNLLLMGRLDAVAAHARAVARFQAERPGSRLLPAGQPLSAQRSYMGFSRPFAASLERRMFEAAYERVLAGPAYADILARNKPLPDMRTEVAARGHRFRP